MARWLYPVSMLSLIFFAGCVNPASDEDVGSEDLFVTDDFERSGTAPTTEEPPPRESLVLHPTTVTGINYKGGETFCSLDLTAPDVVVCSYPFSGVEFYERGHLVTSAGQSLPIEIEAESVGQNLQIAFLLPEGASLSGAALLLEWRDHTGATRSTLIEIKQTQQFLPTLLAVDTQ